MKPIREADVAPESEMFDMLDLFTLRSRLSEKWSRYPSDVIPASIAEMDFPPAPVVTKAIHDALRIGDLGYPYSFTTSSPLQSALATWLGTSLDWDVMPNEILLFADIMRVVETAIELFTEVGDAVVVDTPAYPPFFSAVAERGRTLIANPMLESEGGWRINYRGLQRAFRDGARAYILCNPHNPTGRVFTSGELRSVARLAAHHRVFVVSDEVYSPITYVGHRHIPISTFPEARGFPHVTAMSVTKGWNIAGLKCAFCLPGSDDVYDAFMAAPSRTRDGLSVLGVHATIAAVTCGSSWLQSVLGYLDINRRMLDAWLAQLAPGVSYVRPEGTYVGWLDCRRAADLLGVKDLHELVLERGRVAVADGREFGQEGFLRINFATSRAILAEIVRRISIALAA